MTNFLKIYMFLFVLPFFAVEADSPLSHLLEYDKQTCKELLQAADIRELWDCYLMGRAKLYGSHEANWLAEKKFWINAKNILELGSGNGAYLSLLSERFQDKSFLGFEKKGSYVEEANHIFAHSRLSFVEKDAEIEDEEYNNQFDGVLYRLALQHLKDPKRSLTLVHQYIKKEGYVFIIDCYDPTRCTSHSIHSMEEAICQHNEYTKASSKANRRITIEILEELQNQGPLSNFYELVHSSLDVQGNRTEKGIRLESEEDRKNYFNHALLFLTILKKEYKVSIDLLQLYDDLQVYLEEATCWSLPGMHLLILKKL